MPASRGGAGPSGLPVFSGASLHGSPGSWEGGTGGNTISGARGPGTWTLWCLGRHGPFVPWFPRSAQACSPTEDHQVTPTEAGLSLSPLSASVTSFSHFTPSFDFFLPRARLINTYPGPHRIVTRCRGGSLCEAALSDIKCRTEEGCSHKQLLLWQGSQAGHRAQWGHYSCSCPSRKPAFSLPCCVCLLRHT